MNDHPVIRAAEEYGYYPAEPEYPRCPSCGEECEIIYRIDGVGIIGCENCVSKGDAWEEPECFKE